LPRTTDHPIARRFDFDCHVKNARTAALALAIAAQAGMGSDAEAQPNSPELLAYVTVATDYLNRGMSQTDGDYALNVGVDYQHPSGFLAGAWAANVEYATESARSKPRQQAIDVYVGMGRDNRTWSWTVALARYLYPDISVDYDYSELSASFAWKQHISYTASYTDSLLGRGSSALHQELTGSMPLVWDMALSGGIGHFSSSDLSDDDYLHWNIGVSRRLTKVSVDLRFYDTDYPRDSHLGKPADRHWVLSVSYGFRRGR
jgi:uncharacterized protein (TIGR02001 family)